MSDCQIDSALIANGYEPVVCIGKRPPATAWASRPNTLAATTDERDKYPEATNTGLRTGALVGIDIDLTNPDHAARIEKLAVEMFGVTPLKRVGKKGSLLCYRNAAPIRKITVASNTGKIEILGAGQQFVAYGIHPDTGNAYEWTNHDDISVFDPLNVPLADLPAVTPDQLRVFARRTAQLMQELGYYRAKVTGDLGEKKETTSPSKGALVTAEHLRELLSFINPNFPREDWIRIIAGIRATSIPHDEDEGQRLQIALEFSRGELYRLNNYEAGL